MKGNPQHKLRTQLFSCGLFRRCGESVVSPSGGSTPPTAAAAASAAESERFTDESQTQWKLSPQTPNTSNSNGIHNLEEVFEMSEVQLSTDPTSALHLLERSLVPNPPQHQPPCPPNLIRALTRNLSHAKPATKILFALCLSLPNRRLAVHSGAVSAVIEASPDLHGAPAERALAALELMCTLPEAAHELRSHALAVPVMVSMMAKTSSRAKEYAIGLLSVVYSAPSPADHHTAPPQEVARAVQLALQGDCSARGRRKAAQLLNTLHQLSQPHTNSTF